MKWDSDRKEELIWFGVHSACCFVFGVLMLYILHRQGGLIR